MQADVSKLPQRMQGPVQEYLALLQSLAGERLLAITVFGPAVDEAGADRKGLVQSVVVLDGLDLEFVCELGAQGAMLGRMGIQAPLLMTPEYINASLDTFPIELLDIQQRNVAVLGQDYFAPLEFTRADVRLQLERELKRELIQIRQGILASGGRERALAEIHAAAAEQLLRLLRAVLWLHNEPVGKSPAAILQAAHRVCGVDLSRLEAAVTDSRHADFAALRSLYENVIELADHVDGVSV